MLLEPGKIIERIQEPRCVTGLQQGGRRQGRLWLCPLSRSPLQSADLLLIVQDSASKLELRLNQRREGNSRINARLSQEQRGTDGRVVDLLGRRRSEAARRCIRSGPSQAAKLCETSGGIHCHDGRSSAENPNQRRYPLHGVDLSVFCETSS
jgi:hypothetical protein